MSILLSAYYPEGIVFVADKNATITYRTPAGERKYVEPTATKVLSWPWRRAIAGFVGLGHLAGHTMDEWMRVFIAGSHEFDDICTLAAGLKARIQDDFRKDFSPNADLSNAQLVIHLGGFTVKEETAVPVMYHIWNHGSVDPKTGEYPPGERTFQISEDIERDFTTKGWPSPEDYPTRIRHRLQNMINERRYLWYNNGANIGAFQIFRDHIWHALYAVQDRGFGPPASGLGARVAFCKMAVEAFGSYFTHNYYPEDRVVGGGVDAAHIPWPESAA
jgi:hypothetical protein